MKRSFIKSKKKKSYKNKSLYDNGKKNPRTKTGYGSRKKAEQTIKNIKRFSKSYQKQVVNTMYNRAKYHKYQNEGMRDAMKVYRKWIEKNK